VEDSTHGHDPQPIVDLVTAALADLNDCTLDDRAKAIADIRAYLEPSEARWTTDDVARFLNLGTRASARAQLSAWGIAPTGRQPGRSGQNLYDPAPIRERASRRPGRGARTDLKADR